jgi:two-component system, OmpR family, alkaline phosphatase synthesis response regulator PhoP
MAKKVLVVDDEPSIIKMVESRLKAGGYEVVTATGGEEALRKCRFFKPDVVVLDVMMPDKSGDAVAEEMSEDFSLRHIPIIFLTAIVTKGETPKDTIGGCYFLAKPFKGKELLDMLQRVLGKG